MKISALKLAAGLLLLGAASASSQTLNWASLYSSSIVDSEGTALNSEGEGPGDAFVFELGAFDEGFIPDETNLGQWLDHWNVFDSADYDYDQTSMTSYFTGTQSVQAVSNYSSMFEGLKGYIFIYNPQKSEYFLASHENWVFPDLDPGCCPNGEVTSWSIGDLEGAAPIWGANEGSHGGGGYVAPGPYDIQTHTVPETESALLAMIGCCAAAMRRRRLGAS